MLRIYLRLIANPYIKFYYKMGGHGGLNILPQKKWNVYNHDNRAIVDRDKKLAEAKKK